MPSRALNKMDYFTANLYVIYFIWFHVDILRLAHLRYGKFNMNKNFKIFT